MSSLYDKYGGKTSIKLVVANFYKRLQNSPTLQPFFTGIDVEELISFQVEYFTQLMGGPQVDLSKYGNPPPRLPIKDENFMEVAELLEDTLIESKIEGEDIEVILGLVASSRTEEHS
jgi:hemoglobin